MPPSPLQHQQQQQQQSGDGLAISRLLILPAVTYNSLLLQFPAN